MNQILAKYKAITFGTGRGHRDVPLSGRLLQRSRRHPQPHYGTDRGQAPQRPYRTDDAVLKGRLYEVYQST